MTPQLKLISPKKLIGMNRAMSFVNNTTAELWKNFMPRRNDITNRTDENLISMQIYDASFSFAQFDPTKIFTKWAAVEVTDFTNIPEGMQPITVPEGLYAVFLYKGNPQNAQSFFQYVFGTWLPNSEYEPDQRPHFEVLGSNYKNNDPESEEEVYIPVKLKL